jgi:hypothetical protein
MKPFYSHPGLDFPDTPPHDPNPERNYPIEYQRRFAEETERQRALIAAWRSVSPALRERALAKWWRRS